MNQTKTVSFRPEGIEIEDRKADTQSLLVQAVGQKGLMSTITTRSRNPGNKICRRAKFK